jgi:hypothetical protein
VTSRTYTEEGAGSFGQFLGGVTGAGGLEVGDVAVIPLLREDLVARSNIGLLNAGRRDAVVEVSLREASGTEVAVFDSDVPAGQVVQLNRPFATRANREDVAAGYAVLTVVQGEELSAYGSVVDAGTNDPTTVPLRSDDGARGQWIAAAAHADGAAGSVWRTDLALLNRSDVAAQVEVRYQSGTGELSLQRQLFEGQLLVIEDVVGELGADGSGALEIRSDLPVLAGSRTYSVDASGSFGQYLDGVATTDALAEGDTALLPQLAQNAQYRTNIGLVNTGAEQAAVTIDLLDADGETLATVDRDLAPGALEQLHEPFVRFAGQSDLSAAYAVVTVTSGSGVLCYASMVDNHSNDPTTIPMTR